MPNEILFEDDHIAIVEKPADILIHNSYYARNIKEKTLLEQLKEAMGFSLYPIHRLDRKTSGLIMLAKQKHDVAKFQSLFENNSIQKSYLAVVRGFVLESICIDSPVKHPETGVYKNAETTCIPISNHLLDIPVYPYKQSRYSLVELKPTTGRIHQLRIHMNKISHPIIGDAKYGDRFHNRMFEKEMDCSKILLHAYSLVFKHPITLKSLHVKSNHCPPHWQKLIDKLCWNEEIKTVFKK